MDLAFMDPKDLPAYIGLGVLLLCGLGVFIGIVWYAARKSYKTEKDGAYGELERVAKTRKERNEELEREVNQRETENTELKAELIIEKRKVRDCESDKNELAQHNLRLLSRNTNYERCINKLEKALGWPPTNFDDPTQHIPNPGN